MGKENVQPFKSTLLQQLLQKPTVLQNTITANTRTNTPPPSGVNSAGKENVLGYVEIKDEEPLDCHKRCDHSDKEGGSHGGPFDLHHGLLFDGPSTGASNIPDQNDGPDPSATVQFPPSVLGQIQNVVANHLPLPNDSNGQFILPNDSNNGNQGDPGQVSGIPLKMSRALWG